MISLRTMNLPFTGVMTFGKLPYHPDLSDLDVDVAFLGAGYDLGSLVRPGARYGPRAMRDAYTRSRPFFQIEFGRLFLEGVRMVDTGDVDIIQADPRASLVNIGECVGRILGRGAMPALIGGDHSVTVPTVGAFRGISSLFVLHLGAHLCFQNSAETVSEDTALCCVAEMDHVVGMTHIGIRGPVDPQEMANVRSLGHQVIGPRSFRRGGVEAVLEPVPDGADSYVTIDCSVFDPAVAPGATRPAPGGLSYIEVSDILKCIAERTRVRGFDVTGLTPLWDPTGVSAQTLGRVALDLVAHVFPSS